MALLLAMMRTLVDEGLESVALMERLNTQVGRHAPSSRFITLMLVTINPATGDAVAVNAGHLPGLILRGSGQFDRLTAGGMALGMFEGARYNSEAVTLAPGDLLVLYSDGITEAEDPTGKPFDEEGLTSVVRTYVSEGLPDIGRRLIRAVEGHARDVRFADDLTVLLARRP
jgi:sigma-B regulation protein RsbU (phosphoserine phosphatase)